MIHSIPITAILPGIGGSIGALLLFLAVLCCIILLKIRYDRKKAEAELRSANHFRQMIFHNIKMPIMLFDATGRLIDVNPTACESVGRSRQEILNNPCFNCFCQQPCVPEFCPVRKVLSLGKSASVALSFGKREFIITAEPIRDAEGNISHVLENAVDMTEFNAAQRDLASALEAIRQSQREQQMILDNISIPIFLYDAKGKLLQYNHAAQQISGVSAEELSQRGCETAFCQLTSRDSRCPVMEVVRSRRAAQSRLVIAGRECIITADPITNERGELVNIVKSAIDVTEIEEGKRQQERALKAAQAAERAKSFFIAAISHEIRTPLNAILGFSELLSGKNFESEADRSHLQSILSSGQSLLALVNDLLDLSLLEADGMPLHFSAVDFAELGMEVCAISRLTGEKKEICLEQNIAPMPRLMLDRKRIQQVLQNLVANAVKFTEHGKVELRASFDRTPGADTGTLSFEVRDTGCGIPAADQAKLFEPFGQLSRLRGTCAANQGTGLGLPISRRLILCMGGRTELESEVGKGSVFRCVIPDIKIAGEAVPPPSAPEKLPPPVIKTGKLLLVDDVPMNLKVLEAIMKKQGAEVVTAGSGPAALIELDKDRFDWVMTDLWMPEMNGAELAKEIRRRFGENAPHIAAVTADVEAKSNFDMKLFDVELHKPVTLVKLRTAFSPES